jgi:hypothetical protein
MLTRARACALYHQTSREYAAFSKSVMIGRPSRVRSSYCCSTTHDRGSRSGARRRPGPRTLQRHGCIVTRTDPSLSSTFPHLHTVIEAPKW